MIALTGHSGQVTSLAFSADGRWLATAGWDGAVRLWERPAYQQKRCLRTPYDHAHAVEFSADGARLAIGFRNREYTRDPRGYGDVAVIATIAGPDTDPDSISPRDTWFPCTEVAKRIALHPSGRVLAAQGEPAQIRLWDVDSRVMLQPLPLAHRSVADLLYSPDGGRLATLSPGRSDSAEVHVWHRGLRAPLIFWVQQEQGRALAFAPGGEPLYVGLTSGRIARWELDDADRPKLIRAANNAILDLAVGPDGATMLFACEDGQVRLWDVKSRQVRATFDWKIGTLRCVAFAPDGLTAAAGGDGVVLVWDVDM